MNIELLKRKKRLLCGQSRSVDMRISWEDFNAALSLVLERKEPTPDAILIRRMKCNIEDMNPSDIMYPFAVMIYKQCINYPSLKG